MCRLNAMNEIWVPSEWQRQTFIDSGVDATKLFVVPEVGVAGGDAVGWGGAPSAGAACLQSECSVKPSWVAAAAHTRQANTTSAACDLWLLYVAHMRC